MHLGGVLHAPQQRCAASSTVVNEQALLGQLLRRWGSTAFHLALGSCLLKLPLVIRLLHPLLGFSNKSMNLVSFFFIKERARLKGLDQQTCPL